MHSTGPWTRQSPVTSTWRCSSLEPTHPVYPSNLYAEPDAHRVAGARGCSTTLWPRSRTPAPTRASPAASCRRTPPSALIEAAQDAELLVVGTEDGAASPACSWIGQPDVPPPRLGPRSSSCHRRGPSERPAASSSASTARNLSRDAFDWALTEAAAHDAKLQVINVYDLAPLIPPPGAPMPPEPGIIDKSSQELLEEMTAGAAASGVDIHLVPANGPPARTLLDAARDADLLVVGSRGLLGLRRLLVGSFSQQCVPPLDRPVTIVHPPASDTDQAS